MLTGTNSYGINNHGDTYGYVSSTFTFNSFGGAAVPISVPGYNTNSKVGNTQGGLNAAGNVLVGLSASDPASIPPDASLGLAIWNAAGSTVLSVLDPLYPYANPPDPNDPNSGPSSGSYTFSNTHLNHANQFAAAVDTYFYDPMDPNNPDDDTQTDSLNAYIYNGHGEYSLLQAATAGDVIQPIDIDEAGTVLGWEGDRLALWASNGVLQSFLPDPSAALRMYGYAGYPSVQRNNLGQIVALTAVRGVLLYDPISGTWSDISPSIDGLGTGLFDSIQGFNDVGQFVGLVRPTQDSGGTYGYVVTPVPEPSSWLMLGVTIPALLARRRCR